MRKCISCPAMSMQSFRNELTIYVGEFTLGCDQSALANDKNVSTIFQKIIGKEFFYWCSTNCRRFTHMPVISYKMYSILGKKKEHFSAPFGYPLFARNGLRQLLANGQLALLYFDFFTILNGVYVNELSFLTRGVPALSVG